MMRDVDTQMLHDRWKKIAGKTKNVSKSRIQMLTKCTACTRASHVAISRLWVPPHGVAFKLCCETDVSPGLDPMQSTPVPVSYTKYVTKHMSKIEMGESICTSEAH